MPSELILERIEAQPPLRLKLWTRAEYQFLDSHGFFEGQRFELVEGELINKMGQNERHAYAIQLLTAILVDHFKRQVRIQLPIDVSPQDNPTSEPQPDAVVTTPAAALTSKQPGPGDIVWLVEVSDSTLRFDLTVKARLYARAGIPEYWVVDLIHRNLIVHREPSGDQYLSVNAYGADEPVVVPQSVATLLRFADLIGADD